MGEVVQVWYTCAFRVEVFSVGGCRCASLGGDVAFYGLYVGQWHIFVKRVWEVGVVSRPAASSGSFHRSLALWQGGSRPGFLWLSLCWQS